MPRPAKIWWHTQKASWCVKIAGKLVVLAKGKEAKKEAEKEFYRLKASDGATPRRRGMLVAEICDLYIDHVHRNLAIDTYRIRKGRLKPIVATYGSLSADSFRPLHVLNLLKQREWSKSTQSTTITVIKMAFKWAFDNGYIEANPLVKLKDVGIDRRLTVMSEDEARRLIEASPPWLRDILETLYETGARPGEIRNLRVEQIDFPNRWMTVKGKTGERSFPIPSETLPRLERLCQGRETGFVFLSSQKKPIKPTHLRNYIGKAAKRCGVDAGGFAYSFRHLFISRAIDNGVDTVLIAKIAGHRSLNYIQKHYARPKDETLRRAFETTNKKVQS